MKPAVVLFPGVGGIGHAAPMAELAKAFLNHGYDVTMVLINESSDFADAGAVSRRVAACSPSISVHVLPTPPTDLAASSGDGKVVNPLLRMLELMRRYTGELERFLRSSSALPRCLVADVFCVDALDAAARLGVPAYAFAPTCASSLAALAQVPALLAGRSWSTGGLKELGDAPLPLAGLPAPVPASHLIRPLLERPDDTVCRAMADVWTSWTRVAKGVLVNTFESLERRAAEAMRDLRCVVGGREISLPPVYCVGPLVGDGEEGGEGEEEAGTRRHECLAWLDAQPDRSVVFLCFGSRGAHSSEQLAEIAAGLESSGHRFLWVVRAPPADAAKNYSLSSSSEQHRPAPPPDLDALLPAGFLRRTGSRGLVVASWAPQAAVLRHRATAAFVTHCGWNSALEGVAAGVPMLCWPMHAEQKMNKVFMTAEAGGMGVGVEVEGCVSGFVRAGEVEAKVRLVMEESEEGRQLRARVEATKEEARAAWEEGGSSRAAFALFLSDVERLHEQIAEQWRICRSSLRLCEL